MARVVKLYHRDGTYIKDLPATNIRVEADRQRAVRRSASFRVPSSSLEDVKVLGRRVRIYDGAIQLFGGFIDTPQVTVGPDDITVGVTCRDKAKTFKLARFTQDTTYEDLSATETGNLVTAATASTEMAVGGQIQQYAKVYRRDFSATVLGVSKTVQDSESGNLLDGTYQTSYSEAGLTEFRVQPYIDLRATENVQTATVDAQNPAGPTFSRSSVAYKQDGTQVSANTPRYEAGAFSQALHAEEGTTNLFSSPLDLSQSVWNKRTGTVLDSSNNQAPDGTLTAAQFTQSSGDGYIWQSKTLSPNTTYTISVWARGVSGVQTLSINAWDGSPPAYPGTVIQLTNTWQKYNFTFTTDATAGAGDLGFFVQGVVQIWRPQYEVKAYATSFIDGTRAAESLTIPTAGVFSEDSWTVESWIKLTSQTGAANRVIWKCAKGVNDYYVLRVEGTTGYLILEIANGGVSVLITRAVATTPGTWYQVVARGDGSTATLLVNGAPIDSKTYITPTGALPANIYVGSNEGLAAQINGLIDDFRISRVRTDAEILAAYQTGQPLPVDADTTYKLTFDDTTSNAAMTTTSDMQVSTDGVTWSAYAPGTWRYLRFIAKSPGSTIKLGLTVTTNAAYPASNVVTDGADSWRPTTTDLNRYIDLDFGSAQTVNVLYLRWGINSQDRTTRYVYKIEGSTDKVTWTTLVASTAATASQVVEHVLTSGSYRYLRVSLLQVSGPVALRFAKAQNIVATTSIHSLIQQIAQTEGETLFNLTATRQYAKAITFEAGEEKWSAMQELASTIGWELYYSADEYLTLRPTDIDVTDSNIPTYEALFGFDAEYSDATIYNQVIGVYESAATTYRSVQEDNNAFSATGIPRLGRRTAPVQKNTLADSQQKLDAWTLDLLGRYTRQTTQVSFSMSAVPSHEAGDVIRLVENETGTDGYFTLESFEVVDDPDAGTYDLNARVVQEVV